MNGKCDETSATDPFRQADDVSDPVELMLLEAFLVKGLPSLRIAKPNLHRGYTLKVRPFQQQLLPDADRAERSPLNIPSSPHLPFR